MRNLNFFIILSFAMSSKAQNKLTIEVNGFNNDKGQLILGICDKEVQFLKEFTYKKIEKITNGKVLVVFDNIPSGEYAVSLFHDENNNNNLDTNEYGMPIEKFGFSNNAKGKFGPPKYNDAKISINQNTEIKISLN